MSTYRYILDQRGLAVPCEDLLEWARWIERANRVVAKTVVLVRMCMCEVSTVFLGLDVTFNDTPLLYETVVFGGRHHNYQIRFATRQLALEGHARVVKELV